MNPKGQAVASKSLKCNVSVIRRQIM